MADLSVVASSVLTAGGFPTTVTGTAGATITAGQVVYFDAAAGKYKLAQADSADTDSVVGIAAHGASDGQPIQIITGGKVTLGATLTVGSIYVLSAGTAGGIAPVGDLAASEYVSILGVAQDTSTMLLGILNSGAAVSA